MKISKKSLVSFVYINAYLTFISLLQYYIITYFNYHYIVIYIVYIIRNYILMFVVNHGLKNKKYVTERETKFNNVKSHLFLLSSTLCETLTNIYVCQNTIIEGTSIVYFIPKSFIFEVILDFFHYWTHRILHMNKYIYKYTHKLHHAHNRPTIINAYHFHPLDIFFTITIPMIITFSIMPFSINLLEFNMMSIYKQYTELAGHSGKISYPSSSFPQLIWLPRFLNIQYYVTSHDLHHERSNCNYSKRFSLWDKIFNTYKIKENLI